MELIIGLFGLIFILVKFGGERAEYNKNQRSVSHLMNKRERFRSISYNNQYEIDVEKYIFENGEDAAKLAQNIYPDLRYTFPNGYYKDLIKLVLMSQHGKVPQYLMANIPQDRFRERNTFEPYTIYNLILIEDKQEPDFINSITSNPRYSPYVPLSNNKEFKEKYESFVRWYDKTMRDNGVMGHIVSIREKFIKVSGMHERYIFFHPVSDTDKPISESIVWNVFLPPTSKPE